ncbi:MAG TPA: hypothetical protein VFT60_00030 [Bryobacteraceae bacterium]|jgi:hypothetical protein|nr:hypothetical protein [Bryobacteraceae bacterium]
MNSHPTSQLFRLLIVSSLAVLLFTGQPASAQQSDTSNGRVVSKSANTLTIRTSDGQYQLFVLDSTTTKPASIPVGAEVRITSSEDQGIRYASEVAVTQQPAAGASNTGGSSSVVPPEVRTLERNIERETRRFRVGVRGGVALDPELILIGVQSRIGPFFHRNVYFRPNVEFAWGEVTALFALSPEVIYRLPISSRNPRWAPYFGIGPGFNFLHQNFEKDGVSGKRIDFGEFHSDVGLNLIGGIEYRSGVFMELKTSVYSDPSPTLRLVVGYNF